MIKEQAEGLGGFGGKVALISGSTQGLGQAVARRMVARGLAGLIVTGRSVERGDAVAREFREAGCETHFIPADLAEHEDVMSLVAETDRRFGRLDVLVNAAGNTERGTILDTDGPLYDRIFALNTRAPFFLMQGALRIMVRERIAGSILNVISMSAHGGQSFLAAYCPSKGALVTMTRNTAFAVMRYGCRVNGLCIGWTYTPGEEETMRRFHGAEDGWRETAEAKLPIGRMLDMDEIARTICFLTSGESGMITGSVIDYDQSIPGCFDAVPQPPQIPLGVRSEPPVD
jgi:NAD(P)-dependent dehydrogenase (short-subunit alcohol dehydrogenase family)